MDFTIEDITDFSSCLDIFSYMCSNNNIEMAQLIHDKYNVQSRDTHQIYINQCNNSNNTEIVTWLNNTFCYTSHIHEMALKCVIQNINRTNTEQDIKMFDTLVNNYKYDPIFIELLFDSMCHDGSLISAQFLYNRYKHVITITLDTFISACANNNLNIAIWLYNIYNYTDTYEAFSIACENGNTTTVKWLMETMKYPISTIRFDNDYAFRMACFDGHTEVMDLLKEYYADQNIQQLYTELIDEAQSYDNKISEDWLNRNFIYE